jgi:hypothetical protein
MLVIEKSHHSRICCNTFEGGAKWSYSGKHFSLFKFFGDLIDKRRGRCGAVEHMDYGRLKLFSFLCLLWQNCRNDQGGGIVGFREIIQHYIQSREASISQRGVPSAQILERCIYTAIRDSSPVSCERTNNNTRGNKILFTRCPIS